MVNQPVFTCSKSIVESPNIVSIHKKEDKGFVKNYRPISLLPIFIKIFERLISIILFLTIL